MAAKRYFCVSEALQLISLCSTRLCQTLPTRFIAVGHSPICDSFSRILLFPQMGFSEFSLALLGVKVTGCPEHCFFLFRAIEINVT